MSRQRKKSFRPLKDQTPGRWYFDDHLLLEDENWKSSSVVLTKIFFVIHSIVCINTVDDNARLTRLTCKHPIIKH